MVIPPAEGTIVLPGDGAAEAGAAAATAPDAAAGPVSAGPGAAARAPWWRRRRWLWVWSAVAVFLGFEIWIGIRQEQEGGGIDRARAETLNVLGMEKLGSLANQIGPKDRALADEARRLFENAAAADTTYAVPHNNLGRLAMILGDRATARREYEAALALDPEYATAYLNLAAWLESEGLPQEAVSYYRSAMRYDDSDSLDAMKTAANNLGYFYLAARGQPDSALAVLGPVVERFPHIPLLSKNYGLALLALGRVGEAEAVLTRAYETGGDRLPPVVAALAAAAEARGDAAAAAGRWAELVTLLGPEDANILRRTTLGITGVEPAAEPD
jgi:Tfp pilus assembly protein PilF